MPPDQTPTRHIEAARKRIAHAGALLHASDQADRKILEAATARLKTVQSAIEATRKRAMHDPDAAERYQAAALEAGRLHHVIARAHAVVGEPEAAA
jgi:hypothetical protein